MALRFLQTEAAQRAPGSLDAELSLPQCLPVQNEEDPFCTHS